MKQRFLLDFITLAHVALIASFGKARLIMPNSSVADLVESLTSKYGPMIGGQDLIKCLGFRTQAGFKRSQRLGLLRVHVFEIPNRRGNFALTKDVAEWIHDVSSKENRMNK